MPNFRPTDEQQTAIELFASGQSLAIEAGAGAGKTSTLMLLAETMTDRRGQYVAFNKSIVTEAGQKFPKHVACNTAHSLAFRSIGRRYAHRLNSHRMRSEQIARELGVDAITVPMDGGQSKRLAAGYLAGQVMRAVTGFCQSADLAPTERHFPYIDGIDHPTDSGRRTWANNDELRRALLPALLKAWTDLMDPDGRLPYKHDHYLKAWHLSDPEIPSDVIFFDEAQDANPVLLAIVSAQSDHAQLVFVGDSQQQIYEFTGAVNALAQVPADLRAYLTQSFRFGPAIADQANRILDKLGADLRLRGFDKIQSVVGPIETPKAVLTRTNARAVSIVLQHQRQGRRVHLVGGGKEVSSFARAAGDLQGGGSTTHPELACFTTWGEVQDYTENDPQGSELKLLVGLVDEYGPDTIIAALDRMIPEAAAQLVVSTAHKAKGREWETVQMASDFAMPDDKVPSAAEYRLQYVAATRAQRGLDVSLAPAFWEKQPVAEPPAVPVGDEKQWYDTATGAPIPAPEAAR